MLRVVCDLQWPSQERGVCAFAHRCEALPQNSTPPGREKYPAAVFIELEPDSYYTFRRKIDDMGDVTLKK